MEAIGGMKIWAMGDEDWYVAPTREEALAAMVETMGKTEAELRESGALGEDDPTELSDEMLDKLKFHEDGDGDDPATVWDGTFRERLLFDPPKQPELFATSNF